MQLSNLKFREVVLLVRHEYETAYAMMESWSDGHQHGGGVVVTGQPGIGELQSLSAIL